MSYVSDVLYHFVGRSHPNDDFQGLEKLRSILSTMELWPCQVNGSIEGRRYQFAREAIGQDGELLLTNRLCVCDIPRSQLQIHTGKYGRIGVGVDRRKFAEWGGMPVIYVPQVPYPGGMWADKFLEDTYQAWDGLRVHFPTGPGERVIPNPPFKDGAEAVEFTRHHLKSGFMGYLKRFDATLPSNHPNNFYMEREWRKLGRFGLHQSLRELIVPAHMVDQVKREFPEHSSIVFPLPEDEA